MKILLAIDSSAASELAVDQVRLRPWPPGTNAEVLSVIEAPSFVPVPELVAAVSKHARELVESAASQLRSAGLEATALVLSGDPKVVIVDRAEASQADLVVVGSHGAPGIARFLLGGVARAVVRFSPCSVELVRDAGKASGLRGMKILVATDGSTCSLKAAQSIATRPWPEGTEFHILSVVELAVPMFHPPYPPDFQASEMEALRADAMKRSQDAIRAVEQILTDADLESSEDVSVLLAGPKAVILDEARRLEADLIVVGSHGRRGITRFLLGSVSEAVAVHAHCSVEIVR